jgi:hypothetical protein
MAAGAEADSLRAIREVRLACVIFPPEMLGIYQQVFWRRLTGERMDRH